jgi:hypothetical protein
MITVREAVAEIKADYPGMCVHGLADMGTPAPATLKEIYAEAKRWSHLTQLSRTWLSLCPRITSVRSEEDTYSYKNEIEVWSGVAWVPHIAVLVAARQLGIPMEQNPNRPYAALLPLGAKRP